MQVQGEEFPTVEKFMAKYRLDAPAALERKVFRSSQPFRTHSREILMDGA